MVIKKEFDTIQLIEKNMCWKKLEFETESYIALTDNSRIFVYFSTADYKILQFKKNSGFQIANDQIIFDEANTKECSL